MQAGLQVEKPKHDCLRLPNQSHCFCSATLERHSISVTPRVPRLITRA